MKDDILELTEAMMGVEDEEMYAEAERRMSRMMKEQLAMQMFKIDSSEEARKKIDKLEAAKKTQGPRFDKQERVRPEYREGETWFSGKIVRVMKLSEAAKAKDAEESRVRSQWAYKIVVTRGRKGFDRTKEWIVHESDLAPCIGGDKVEFEVWSANAELEDAMEEAAEWSPQAEYACDILEYLEKAINTARQTDVQQNKIVRAQKRYDQMYHEIMKHIDTIKTSNE